jgi:hypothetical protein
MNMINEDKLDELEDKIGDDIKGNPNYDSSDEDSSDNEENELDQDNTTSPLKFIIGKCYYTSHQHNELNVYPINSHIRFIVYKVVNKTYTFTTFTKIGTVDWLDAHHSIPEEEQIMRKLKHREIDGNPPLTEFVWLGKYSKQCLPMTAQALIDF